MQLCRCYGCYTLYLYVNCLFAQLCMQTFQTCVQQLYLFPLQQNKTNQDDVDGVSNAGIMKDPSHLNKKKHQILRVKCK